MNKNEIRWQMVNELCETARSFANDKQLVLHIGKVVDKHLARISMVPDNLTQDSYRNPMVKLMRTQAFNYGCYGCANSVKDKRNWQCKIETELNIKLNYPNTLRRECKFSAEKKREIKK